MGYIVKCPICGKTKKIYRNSARFFVCCHTIHTIKDNLIRNLINWKNLKNAENLETVVTDKGNVTDNLQVENEKIGENSIKLEVVDDVKESN
ncbi:MAG: hypothetical protein ACTSWZ_00750 [Candidatus Heimdallarchaeaceae archaeon]